MVKTFSAFWKLANLPRSNNQNFFGPEVFFLALSSPVRTSEGPVSTQRREGAETQAEKRAGIAAKVDCKN